MARVSFSSLRVHLLALVLIAIVSTLVLVLYTGLEHRRLAAFEAQKDALRRARRASRNHERLIGSTRQLLIELARIPEVRSGDRFTCSSFLADILENRPIYTNLGVIEPDGDVSCSGIPISNALNFADRASFQGALETHDFAIGDYQIGPITGKAAISFGYPIVNNGDEVQAVVFAALDLAWLNRFAAEADLPPDSTLTVIDGHGRILVRYPDVEKWVGRSISETTVVQSMLSQGEGVTEAVGPDGVPRLYAFTPLNREFQNRDAYVSVGIPTKVAFAEADAVLSRNLQGLALAAFLVLIAAWLVGDVFLLRRLNVLLTAARRLSAGDLSARTGLVDGPRELTQLSRAFDEMAETLEKGRAEADWAQKELRKALEESGRRTAEVSALLEGARTVLEYQDFEDAVQPIFGSCKTLIQATAGYVSLLSEDETTSEAILIDAEASPAAIGRSCSMPIVGLHREVYSTAKAIYRNEFSNGEREKLLQQGHIRLDNVLTAPLVIKGKVVGFLGLANKSGGFTENDAQLASAFGELAAVALHNSRTLQSLEDSEGLFRNLSNSSPIGIYIVQEGKFQFANPEFQKHAGYSEEELLGMDSLTLVLPKDRTKVRDNAVKMLKGGSCRPYEYRIVNKAGEIRWIMETVAPIEYKGRPAVLGNFMDITERKKAEEALARSHDFYLTLFDALPTPIRRSGMDGRCDHFNKSWLAFTGRSVEQELGDGWKEGLHPEDAGRYVQTYYDAFKVRQPFEIEYRLRRHDGEYRWIVETGRPFDDLDGNFAGYIASCYDITDRKQQEEQLAYLATHDPLTGLPNRRSLEEAMRRVVARARRGTVSALLFLDVDNFKLVNDTLGHTAGDRALTTLVRLLQEQLRTEDLLARLGGDEFAVLLEGADVEEARAAAERMRRAVEEFSVNLDGIGFNLSVSIGLVAIDGQETSAAALSQADAAMYRAKEQGRNRIVVYQRQGNDLGWLSEANRLAMRLKDALK